MTQKEELAVPECHMLNVRDLLKGHNLEVVVDVMLLIEVVEEVVAEVVAVVDEVVDS